MTSRRRSDAIPGIIDLHSEQLIDIPQIQVQVDLAKAQAFGVKPGDVRRIASTYMAGEEVGDIFNTGKALRRRRLERAAEARERDRRREPPHRYRER